MPEEFSGHLDRVGLMIKPASDSCPGACHYCYYHDPKKGRYHEEIMDPALLEEYIKQFMALGCPMPMMSWQGGEPSLAGLDYFKQAIAWQKEYSSTSQHVQNAFQTCGLLLDEDWCKFLAEEKFLVGLSVDGPKDLHDSIRVDREGNPTYDRVTNAYKMLKDAGAEVNILSVISTKGLGREKEIYSSIRELGADFMQFIPCGPGREGRGHARLMVRGLEYADFMLAIMDAWIDEDNPSVYMRTNDNLLHLYYGLPCEFCQFTRGCLSMVTAEADGSLYPCDFFVEDKYKLGRIQDTPLKDLIFNEVHRRFFHDTGCSNRQCRECRWYRYCHGGCLRQRNGHDARGKNMLCDSMKALFEGAFKRFDTILSGENPKTQQLTAFMRDIVRRYGWPRESSLPCPSGVKPVAGGPQLHKTKNKGRKKR